MLSMLNMQLAFLRKARPSMPFQHDLKTITSRLSLEHARPPIDEIVFALFATSIGDPIGEPVFVCNTLGETIVCRRRCWSSLNGAGVGSIGDEMVGAAVGGVGVSPQCASDVPHQPHFEQHNVGSAQTPFPRMPLPQYC